jgi:hypothetical protein
VSIGAPEGDVDDRVIEHPIEGCNAKLHQRSTVLSGKFPKGILTQEGRLRQAAISNLSIIRIEVKMAQRSDPGIARQLADLKVKGLGEHTLTMRHRKQKGVAIGGSGTLDSRWPAGPPQRDPD